MKGTVVKILSFEYYVQTESGVLKCSGRGRLKRDGDIYVGDHVEVQSDVHGNSIEKVHPRQNCLIRPYVANIDTCIIVVAPAPEPDYILCDKILANCLANGIQPTLCFNKTDIATAEQLEDFNLQYSHFERLVVSALTGEGLDKLMDLMANKVCCFAGQSAVGKTSLLNALIGSDVQTGELSRIMRGKNTTRHTEAYALPRGGLLVDTCGFSLLELDMPCEKLAEYYPEFMEADRCKFNTCNHISEPDCGIRRGVEKGSIVKGRYDRYVILFEALKNKKKKY